MPYFDETQKNEIYFLILCQNIATTFMIHHD